MQCSHSAKPFPSTHVYYFEVMINSFNLNRPGIAIGLTDETFVLNKIPGSSRRSYGLRSDGKLLHAISQGLDFSPKFEQNDVIGCGIAYISRKIFFTRNGELLGKPFDMLESYPIFASASISCPQDSVTFTFTGPFQFDLSGLISDEKTAILQQKSARNPCIAVISINWSTNT